MKSIKNFINESTVFNTNTKSVIFNGHEFQMDQNIGSNVHNDIDNARTVDEFTDEMFKDLKKQGVKYVLCWPPHYYAGNEKNDVFIIKMFIKSKKKSDSYRHTQAYALYDVKTGECINKDDIRAYKVIRYR